MRSKQVQTARDVKTGRLEGPEHLAETGEVFGVGGGLW